MPTTVYPTKSEALAAYRKQQAAECLRLYGVGLSRAEIGRQLGMDSTTVSKYLAELGVPPLPVAPRWDDKDLAILAPAVADRSITPKKAAAWLPHRSYSSVRDKLKLLREAAGAHKPPTPAPEPDRDGRKLPNWALPPGAMRNRRGITLVMIPTLQEAHHG